MPSTVRDANTTQTTRVHREEDSNMSAIHRRRGVSVTIRMTEARHEDIDTIPMRVRHAEDDAIVSALRNASMV